jgi:hypothetical protein
MSWMMDHETGEGKERVGLKGRKGREKKERRVG